MDKKKIGVIIVGIIAILAAIYGGFIDKTIIGVIIGGTVAILAAVYSVRESHKLSEQATIKREELHELGVLQAISDEMETIKEVYKKTIGDEFEKFKDGELFNMIWPVNQNYFTVYENNAEFIGKIKNNSLRKEIVSTYTVAKSVIDSFCFNNTLVQKFEVEYYLFEETKNPINQLKMNVYHKSLVDYAAKLKKGHTILKTKISELLQLITEELERRR